MSESRIQRILAKVSQVEAESSTIPVPLETQLSWVVVTAIIIAYPHIAYGYRANITY